MSDEMTTPTKQEALEALERLKSLALFEIEEFADIKRFQNMYQTIRDYINTADDNHEKFKSYFVVDNLSEEDQDAIRNSSLFAEVRPMQCRKDGWMPIETMPLNGTIFFIHRTGCSVPLYGKYNKKTNRLIYFSFVKRQWIDSHEEIKYWMPLPTPPEQASADIASANQESEE